MKIILIAIIALLVLIIAIYAYYGGFKKINFVVSEQGGEVLIYEELIGDYKQSPTIMDKIYHSLLNNEKIETYKGFGIYYDNPQKVEKAKLRSDIGCILEDKDSIKIAELTTKYNIKTCAKSRYIVAEFPYKAQISIIIGIMRVYPALAKHIQKNGYNENSPIMEIYDIPNKKIVYRMEIEEKTL